MHTSASTAPRPTSSAMRDAQAHGGLAGEAVADPAHGLDALRIGRVELQLLAQVAHVHVDRARLAVVGRIPDASSRFWRVYTRPGERISVRRISNST